MTNTIIQTQACIGRFAGRLRLTTMLAVLVLSAALASQAGAASFPDRPITVYSPSAAGSASDVQARVLARGLTGILGQPVTVIDMDGGSGSVAEAQLQSRPADGYTLLFEPSSLLTYTVGTKMIPFTPADFTGVAGVGGDAVCLVVRTDDPRFPSLPKFVEYAHAHPDTLTVAGYGTAGVFALTYVDLARTSKIQARYIPYNGGGPLMVALLGAHVDAVVTAPSNVISNDKLHILAIASQATFAPLPSTPTFLSFGYEVVRPVQRGFFARAGLPAPVMQKLAEAIKTALQDAQWQKIAKQDVIETTYIGPAAWQAYLAAAFKDQAQTATAAPK